MPFGGLLTIGVGAGLGALKTASKKNKADEERKIAATQARVAPYTGRTNFQAISDPGSYGEGVLGGAGAGMNAASTFGAFRDAAPMASSVSSGGSSGPGLGVDTNLGSYGQTPSSFTPMSARLGGGMNSGMGLGTSMASSGRAPKYSLARRPVDQESYF